MANSPPPFALFTSNFDFSLAGMNILINQMNALFPNVTTAGDQTTSGNLAVAGTSALTGAVTITGALTTTGLSTLNGGIAGGSSANIAINTNKLTVTASTGATLIAGLLTLGGGLTQAPNAGGSTITLTAAKAGSVTLLDTVGGTTVTLPAATGTGNVYRFACTATTTSNAHKILAVGSDYLIGMINGVRTTAITPFLALVGSVYQSLQMPFAGSQPSGGIQGDWFEFQDVASAKWEVRGQFSAGTTATTPFNTATS